MFHDFFEKGTFAIICFSQTFCQLMKIRQKKILEQRLHFGLAMQKCDTSKPRVHYFALHRRFKENGERREQYNIVG